jgi:hypothetical protein
MLTGVAEEGTEAHLDRRVRLVVDGEVRRELADLGRVEVVRHVVCDRDEVLVAQVDRRGIEEALDGA